MSYDSIREAQDFVSKFVKDRNWETPASDILVHLLEELGEVARNVLKMKGYGGQHTNDSGHDMDEELADVFYLILKLANETGVDLTLAFNKKIGKNLKRFPV